MCFNRLLRRVAQQRSSFLSSSLETSPQEEAKKKEGDDERRVLFSLSRVEVYAALSGAISWVFWRLQIWSAPLTLSEVVFCVWDAAVVRLSLDVGLSALRR